MIVVIALSNALIELLILMHEPVMHRIGITEIQGYIAPDQQIHHIDDVVLVF